MNIYETAKTMMETCALVSSGRRHCLLLTEVVQVSFLLPYLCSSGQGKLMSEWLFGTRSERGLFLECHLQGADEPWLGKRWQRCQEGVQAVRSGLAVELRWLLQFQETNVLSLDKGLK